MRIDIADRKTEIVAWIKENRSKAYIHRQLKCKPETLERWLKKLGIEYRGNPGGKGYRHSPKRLSAVKYAATDYPHSDKLRKKLIEDGIKTDSCELCHRSKWNGGAIPLELDHKDGDHYNNDLCNLRVICPNCHALTPTNSGRNIGKRGL